MRDVLAATAIAMGVLLAAPARAAEVTIDDLVVATAVPAAERDATVAVAKAFYQFWNSGDEAVLKAAISDNFIDQIGRAHV